jgi:hypothetical protein
MEVYMSVVAGNEIIREAISKCGLSVKDFFLWCTRELRLEAPENVAERLKNEYNGWQQVAEDIPSIHDLAYEVLTERKIPTV